MACPRLAILAAVPIKPFGVAKRRLAPVLDAATRSRLGKAVASRTLEVVTAAGGTPAVVTADDGVARWARSLGVEVLLDPGVGLDAAATTVLDAARGRGMRWSVVHADLPCVSATDMEAVFTSVPGRGVSLTPSVDGGTNVIAGDVDHFAFRYGPASYHHHLRAAIGLPRRVVIRWGLALDLDAPIDLDRALGSERGTWLWDLLGAGR